MDQLDSLFRTMQRGRGLAVLALALMAAPALADPPYLGRDGKPLPFQTEAEIIAASQAALMVVVERAMQAVSASPAASRS